MRTPFRFIPISTSWVAVHPQPRGIIQFIGGAFFGTVAPTLFYRYFLRQLFDKRYTIVVFPFRFTFQQWLAAIALLNEHGILRKAISDEARKSGYDTAIYEADKNYIWIGHSWGCKYLVLLELLSDENWRDRLNNCLEESREVERVEDYLDSIKPGKTSILNQALLMIAPATIGTKSAIPDPLARFFDRLGLGVNPQRQYTRCFINDSPMFNRTAIISFTDDAIAGSIDNSPLNYDVPWFYKTFKNKGLIHQELPGKHLEPMTPTSRRYLEEIVGELIEQLREK